MKSDEAVELLRECRAAIEPLTGAQIKLHSIAPDLAVRLDALLAQPNAAPQTLQPAGHGRGVGEHPATTSASAAPDSGMPEEPTRFIPVWHKKFMAADR